ncbi:hypothetical protein SprV_0602147400 [Sparganum proliferum]
MTKWRRWMPANLLLGRPPKAGRRDAGIAFAIRKDFVGQLPCLPQGINDRPMNLRLHLRGSNFATIPNAHTPPKTGSDEAKAKFHEDLRALLTSQLKADKLSVLDDTCPRASTSTPRRKRRRHDCPTSASKKKKKRQYWMLCSQQDIIMRLTDLCSKVESLEAQVRRLIAASTPLPVEEGPAWQQLCYLSGAGGENTSAFAGRIFSTLFTEDVTDVLTFYGKEPGSRAFFGSPIYDLILEVFNKWCASHVSDRQKLEDAFKNVFKRAHDRQQRRCNKASTSGLQNDAPPAEDPDRTSNDGIQDYP